MEEEYLPTDVVHAQDDLTDCIYRDKGCKVRTPGWRVTIHAQHCNYKDSLDEITDALEQAAISCIEYEEDPEELVECRYRKYGCMVNMRRRRKPLHEAKCNYRKYHAESDDSSSEGEYDPDEQISCKWAEYGCRVRPKYSRLETHEQKCNYRLEECAYKDNGCIATFQPSRKYAHERNCEFAC